MQQRVVDALDMLEREGQLAAHHDACVEVMIAWCDLIRHLMSPTIASAHEAAKHHAHGRATRDELDQARIACWKELDAMDWNSRHDDPCYLAGRAVICVLFPDFPDRGESEGGHMFLCSDFANRAEDHSAEQERLLLSYFARASAKT
jgi:hypothetical protein